MTQIIQDLKKSDTIGQTVNTIWGNTLSESPFREFANSMLHIASTEADLRPMDNILLNLRMSGLRQHSNDDIKKIVRLGLPISGVAQIFLSPLTLISDFKSFLLSALIALIPYQIFNLIGALDFFLLTIFIWAVLNVSKVSSGILAFVFDFVDFLSGGYFTRVLISKYFLLPQSKQKDFISPKNENFVSHFFASRQPYRPANTTAWETHFTSISTEASEEGSLDKEVEAYWKQVSEDENFYVSNPVEG